MQKLKTTKGVTLVALVVTIIVLLILAGITIQAVVGNNGIMTKAKEAKLQTEIAEEREIVNFAVSDSRTGDIINGGNGILTKESLQKSLDLQKGTGKTTVEEIEGGFSITFTESGRQYEVSENEGTEEDTTKPFDPETLIIGDAINTKQYGWKVTNYTVKTTDGPDGKSENSGVWRLFYQDSNYTYIISDDYVGNYYPSYYSSYIKPYDDGSKKVSVVGKKLNSMITSLFTDKSNNLNIQITAWLTNPEEWSAYKNEDAVFAIGSPTAELFVKSYNSSIPKKTYDITLEVGNDGYVESNTSMDKGENYGIYDNGRWWIASPCDASRSGGQTGSLLDNYLNMVWEWNSGGYVDVGTLPVRPIVCIPTTVFDQKYIVVDE